MSATLTDSIARLKESNYWLVRDFANHNKRKEMEGVKLQALYRLIQMKGKPMKSEDKELNGVVAMRFSEHEAIAIQRTGFGPNFFPCKLKTYSITIL